MCLAVPMRIKAIQPNNQAIVELGGVERIISVVMTPEAQVGDYVLIHAGYAISVLDPAEAENTFLLLREMLDSEVGSDLRDEVY